MRKGTARFGALLGALAVIASACTSTARSDETSTSPVIDHTDRPQAILAAHSLEPFDACEGFLDYVISHAVDLVGPYGLENPGRGPWPVDGLAMDDEVVAEASSPQSRSRDFSNTNVQVEGVDEPDMVKTDGERIVVLSEGSLVVVDITGPEPREMGRLRVDHMAVRSLFLSDDTALLFGSSRATHPMPLLEGDAAELAPVPQSPTVQLIEVDISAKPEIRRTMSIDGSFLSGRMVGDSVRLVTASGPVGFEWSYPKGSGLRAERKAIEENREIIENSTEANWIPYYLVTDSDGDVTDEGVLFDCNRASHPENFSGLNMLSVVTIDLSEGLDVVDATGLLATGSTVYSSSDDLYVATQRWRDWQWARESVDGRSETVVTDIHKFDISDPGATNYSATGRVEGFLLNQFAMDEHEGLLRVASTTSPNRWGAGLESESMVTILHEVNGELVRVGRVEGLGKTEQIYSVRFMGDVGYVVTFRQTDPLYTIDLSDPTDPRTVGELKILGYSAYLHPLGDDLLMGVGQDATEQGRIQGTQVSLFDVSDPANPQRVDTYTLSEGSNSQVEYDHHAFLYWDPERLAMIPVQQWRWDERTEKAFFGVVGLRVSESGEIIEVERVVHPGGAGEKDLDWRAQIYRSVVIGDSVYTISAKGVMQSDIQGLQETAWLDL